MIGKKKMLILLAALTVVSLPVYSIKIAAEKGMETGGGKVAVTHTKASDTTSEKSFQMSKNFYIGVDNAGDTFSGTDDSPVFLQPLKDLGVEFLVYHYSPRGTTQDQLENIRGMNKFFEKNGMYYIINTEVSNWVEKVEDNSGWDWCRWPDATHRFNFKPEVLKAAVESKAFAGVMYDEAEHMQINRSWVFQNNKKIDLPFLGETTGLSFEEADKLINKNAADLVGTYKKAGTPYVISEHVWPVLFHNFAKAGMTPSYKQMKEGWTPVWAACAMGASLQYNRELWTCLDLWFLDKYPGHSPEELKSNLLFGYWMGNDKMYVENLNYQGSLYTVEDDDGTAKVRLSPWGEVFKRFAKEYVPKNPRNFTFRDVKPQIAIIRFDDTDCGQKQSGFWQDWLLGSKKLRPNDVTSNWMKIWNVVSHGVIHDNALSWNYEGSYGNVPHKSFAPMNGVVVFDDTVRRKNLESVKLAFLTGIKMNKETLADIDILVKEKGLVVVTDSRFAPASLKGSYMKGTVVKPVGTKGGKWIITDNVQSEEVKKNITPYLGKKDEIRYVFGNKEVIFKIGEKDQLSVSFKDVK